MEGAETEVQQSWSVIRDVDIPQKNATRLFFKDVLADITGRL